MKLQVANVKKLVKSLRRNYDKKVVRTLKDMKKYFLDKDEVKKILKKKNSIIYTVFIKKLELNKMIGLTVINPGSIGKEYYFTKGHKHKKPLSEIYILLNGKGDLILQNKKSKVVCLKRGEKIIVPGKSAHRLVNIGKKKLEVVSIYNKNAGHDYNVKFKRRVLKK